MSDDKIPPSTHIGYVEHVHYYAERAGEISLRKEFLVEIGAAARLYLHILEASSKEKDKTEAIHLKIILDQLATILFGTKLKEGE